MIFRVINFYYFGKKNLVNSEAGIEEFKFSSTTFNLFLNSLFCVAPWIIYSVPTVI